MWVVNVILIFTAIAVMGWLLWSYGGELIKALGIFFTGGQSVLFALGVLLVEAVKAAVISAVVGAAFYGIFYVARAPQATTKSAAISVAVLAFALLMLKALWENLNNLRWSIRNEIRNRYRKR
ncbi:hypothetical protein H6F96_12805 [Microcoleus sp. FACHB-53]|nr:hypothetical protein [Microcoleus sp. FACHB-53]